MKLMVTGFALALAGTSLILIAMAKPVSSAQAVPDKSASTSEGKVSLPSCRQCPDPDFPKEALKAKIPSAVVVLDVQVSVEGQPEDIQVVSDPGHGFADSAVKAVSKWQFNPAKTKNGKNVASRVKVEVSFRSQRKP